MPYAQYVKYYVEENLQHDIPENQQLSVCA